MIHEKSHSIESIELDFYTIFRKNEFQARYP